MKALILAGGKGTRLRPITHTASKQMVPVANRPVLFYALDHMVAAGITDIGMIVGDTADEIMNAVGDGANWGANVTYIRQDAPLGLAHAVLIARDFLGDDDFVMYLGDNLLRDGISSFVKSFRAVRNKEREPTGEHPAAQILLAHVPDPHRFGVVEFGETGGIKRLVEKPADPPSDLALVGVYIFDKSIHEAVRSIAPSARGELEITEAIQWLVDNGKIVRSEVVEGYWKDLGELDAILEGNGLILERMTPRIDGIVDEESDVDGRVIVEPGARVIRSTIRGPVIIGNNARIVDSYVGPFTSIARDCEIISAEVEHSMILEHAHLSECGRVEDSLVGQHAMVTRSRQRPIASRLMIGDHSKVDLG